MNPIPRVLVPLAQGCEELEAVTVIDLLRRANIEVITAGLDEQAVIASRGVQLIPDTTLDAVIGQAFDMIVLPGGLPGADHLNADPRIHTLLDQMHEENKFTAAICAAPKVFAQNGLLDGKTATSYPGAIHDLDLPSTRCTDAAVEIDGKLITSKGPGTAMDFALTLIEQLLGKTAREAVEIPLMRHH